MMNNSDEIEEPCAFDRADDAGGRSGSAMPPVGMTWWSGRWPPGGVNSVADLEWWVALRLEEMIDLQGDDSLAEIGRLLGLQALKNADRYLGQQGDGGHPRRPSDDQLQRVEDVEDALEAILRHIRQKSLSAAPVQPNQTLPVPPAPPSSAVKHAHPPKRSWKQDELEAAIQAYIAQRAASYNSLREAVRENRRGAVDSARKTFGRNTIVKALGVKSGAMVTKSPAWKQAATELGLSPYKMQRMSRPRKTGLDIAVEEKTEATDPVADDVERRDAIRYVNKHLKGQYAEAIVAGLNSGKIPPERVEEMVETLLSDGDDDGARS